MSNTMDNRDIAVTGLEVADRIDERPGNPATAPAKISRQTIR
jgi:hypothetical protein